MKNSLSWRFAIIVVIVALAGIILKYYPLRLGIDLAGGTSLLYELDLSKLPNSSDEQHSELANRVVAVLKKRVDPQGQKNLIWRVVAGKRIQIQMPLADKAAREAKEELEKAKADLQAASLRESEIIRLINLSEPQRTVDIDKKSPPDTHAKQNELLKKLATANDRLKAAREKSAKYSAAERPEEVREEQLKAENEFQELQRALAETNINYSSLLSTLSAADDPQNKEAQEDLAKFLEHSTQKTLIQRLVDAHRKLMSLSGGGVDDANDLKRMITTTGVLDFRITVDPKDVSQDTYNQALKSLNEFGPSRPISLLGTQVRWMGIDPLGRDNFERGGYVLASWGSNPYVLCYDDDAHTLTHGKEKPWSVSASSPQPSERGLMLPFRLDVGIGGRYMEELTSNNRGKPMAILLDDKAMSAPNINATIRDSGVIEFGSGRPIEQVKKEADNLRNIIDAGSLPASLQKQPISVVEISPDLGADNINAGYTSGIYALIAVVAFMLVYYTITGFFADLALGVNLLLMLSTMAFLQGTFTLPGIAGLVLTLGMAVDANVLINERIREELHKGASLWMAVKQGYDKVFWTIFDANLTTSLTAIVLIYVGSEEVKGFGVTLLIGLTIHMFTALFVTRTLMMGAIRVGLIRAIDDHSISEYFREIFTFTWLRNGHFPFMRVITVTNIDWIGKRHIFWVISAVTIIAGVFVFVARGEDKYDIEFRGGTQVTFKLVPDEKGHVPKIEEVRKRITEELAHYKEADGQTHLKDLSQARVYQLGKLEDNVYEMQTTIANPKDQPDFVEKHLLNPLAEKFKDVLKSTPKLTIRNAELTPRQVAELDPAEQFVRPITGGTLDKAFENSKFNNIPPVDVVDFRGGVAVLLEDINPPQTAKSLYDRIKQTRASQHPEIRKIPYRDFKIVPITAVDASGKPIAASEDDARPLVSAIMVSKDEAQPYEENSEALWRENVANTEWTVIRTAISTSELFQGVTSFDAVVASQAKIDALTAIIISLILIVVYVWIRFGGIRYGLGAIFSLVHDAVVALAATVLAKYVASNWLGEHMLITDFKINLTMIAAYLTVIGYSVNDTIVIFDRVRELRGKSQAPLSPKLINDAINQCFGRTIWTTFTVFIVVLIMYIWGGEGVRGFSFAMLVGVITGAYSTLAIASPMLLATGTSKQKAGVATPGGKAITRNPFLRPEATEKGV